MRRPLLLALVVVGSLVVLIGGTGLFAALTDTARTGINQVDSAQLAASADIQLAPATVSSDFTSVSCGGFSEDLASGWFTASNVTPGYGSGVTYFCIKNVGSQPVTVSAVAEGLIDLDTGCSGDEALHGDATCGLDQLGELSSVINVHWETVGCGTGVGSGAVHNLFANTTTPHTFINQLAPGTAGCYSVGISYPTSWPNIDVQKAQSDRVTWRFKFTGQA